MFNRRRADFYALLCNLLARKKGDAWQAEDFMPKSEPQVDQESEEAKAAIDSYEAAMTS